MYICLNDCAKTTNKITNPLKGNYRSNNCQTTVKVLARG